VNCWRQGIDATTRLLDDDDVHRVVIVVFEGVQSLDVAGPAEVFAGANSVLDHRAETNAECSSGSKRYSVTIASLDGGVVGTESAVRLDSLPFASLRGPIDTLVIPGGLAVWHHRDDARFIRRLQSLISRTTRLVTVCSGAAIAAATGALDGHRITTHWARADRLAEAHPDIVVDAEPIFIYSANDQRDVWSSAGVTAGIDLSLAIVEHDHSTDIAQEVGRWLVMYLRRPGGQSQFASPTWIRQAPVGPIQIAQDLVINDPGADHRVSELARHVAMSERHFVRRFRDEVGLPPAKFVAAIRVDAARHELEQSTDTVATIARRCGLGTAETLRRTLHRHLGVSPEAYRQRFSHRAPTTPPSRPEPRSQLTPRQDTA
jgi:transcriptional regulator GlxA family with amidase domain